MGQTVPSGPRGRPRTEQPCDGRVGACLDNRARSRVGFHPSFSSVTFNGDGSMESTRENAPNANRAAGSAHQTWPSRPRPRPMSGVAPATSPRLSVEGRSRGDPKESPRIPAPPNVHPLPHQPKLLDRLREALRARHYSPRTEQTYRRWVKRFIFFHNVRHPVEMAEPEINTFLTARRQSGRGYDRNRQACHLSHPTPLACDAPARGRLRYSDHSRVARAQGRGDDDDLHPRCESRRQRGAESGGRFVRAPTH